MSSPEPTLDGNAPPQPPAPVERTSQKRVRISTPSSPSLQRIIRRKLNPSLSPPLTSSIANPLKAAKEARLRRDRSTSRSRGFFKGKKPVRPVQNTSASGSDNGEAVIDSDEEEVQETEAGLFNSSSINAPSSPTPGSAGLFPTQRTFPVGETLTPFARALTAPPSSTAGPSTPRELNLPSSSRTSSSSPVPEYIRLRSRAQSFSTPRIADVDEILGETTDDDETDSGRENDSDVWDEIEEEYQEKYKQDAVNMSTPSVLLPSPFPNTPNNTTNANHHNGSHHPSHSSNTIREIRKASSPYAKAKRAQGRAVTGTSIEENRKLGPSVTVLAAEFMQLESPAVRRAEPYLPATPTSPTPTDRDESDIENRLVSGDEMQVDTATEGDVDTDAERVLSMTMPSSSDSESDVETRMDIPSTDLARLHHQERLITLRSTSSLSFAGQRSKALYKARHLTDVLAENPWIGSLKIARHVAVRRRGASGGKIIGSVKRSGSAPRINPKKEGVERMLLDLQQYRERKVADQTRRRLMNAYLNELRVLGMTKEWLVGTLMGWATLHGQAEIFQRITVPAASAEEAVPVSSAEEGIIEVDNANGLPFPMPADYAGIARPHQDMLENYEAEYPEARERLLVRQRENPPEFEIGRHIIAISAPLIAVCDADDARDARMEEERWRRNREEERAARRQREADAQERRMDAMRARDEDARLESMRLAQIANWQAVVDAQRQSQMNERAHPFAPFPTFSIEVDRQTQAMVAEAAREREAEMVRNPHPPSYPASPTQNVPTTPVVRPAAALPVTPPLPGYAPNTYGHRSPPPPPPYNAISGYTRVEEEVDDLLLDDDEEEDEDDVADLLGGSTHAPAAVPAPLQMPAAFPQRMLTLAEMQAEQQVYQAIANEAGDHRPILSRLYNNVLSTCRGLWR